MNDDGIGAARQMAGVVPPFELQCFGFLRLFSVRGRRIRISAVGGESDSLAAARPRPIRFLPRG
jgi:hypothetical protein